MHQIPRTIVAGVTAALIVLACVAALPSAGSRSPGGLDRGFGDGGLVTTGFPTGTHARAVAEAVALEPNGRIVLAGRAGPNLALVRYRPNGSLDRSFADRGRLLSDLSGAKGVAAAVEPDGRIVVAGSSNGQLALARYLPDGTLDSSFGHGGEGISGLAPRAEAIALGGGGTILVVAGGAGKTCRGATLARYLPDGSLDPSFGNAGEVTAPFGCAVSVVMQGPRIVLAGTRAGSGGGDFALARYQPDGSLDRSFGDGGLVVSDLGGDDESRAAATGGDGRVVVAGSSDGHLALARYSPDGSLDPSFAEGGEAIASGGATSADPAAVVPTGDGGLVVAGSVRRQGSPGNRFALWGYGPEGSLDRSFGDGGRTLGPRGAGEAAALQPHGGLLAAGTAPLGGSTLEPAGFALARFTGAGSTPASPGPAGGGAERTATASAAKGRPRRHRAPPPKSVPAWYINASSFREMKRNAATDACAFARAQPRGAHRTLILDFGGARAYHDGGFGAALNHEAFKANNHQIELGLQIAADAYVSCHRQGRARIAYANTNHFENHRSATQSRRIGAHQARTVRDVLRYQRHHGYDPTVTAGVAGDIEMGFWGPRRSKQLVKGAKSVWDRGYIDFGTAGGCPPHPDGLHLRGCFNGWTVSDVAQVSRAGHGAPVPEIYYLGGPSHFDHAAQWANVARSWNKSHRTSYSFAGATGSTEFSKLSPGESWKRLRQKAPGKVRRELLNFKQDRTLAKVTAGKRDAGGG
jgi:uncharacterized delta-60 repeat protein